MEHLNVSFTRMFQFCNRTSTANQTSPVVRTAFKMNPNFHFINTDIIIANMNITFENCSLINSEIIADRNDFTILMFINTYWSGKHKEAAGLIVKRYEKVFLNSCSFTNIESHCRAHLLSFHNTQEIYMHSSLFTDISGGMLSVVVSSHVHITQVQVNKVGGIKKMWVTQVL